MDLSNLTPAEGSVKKGKRIGRGQGSGRGGTSTKGHNGAQSRAGYSRKMGFEGGQMPLQRRVPKGGFKNPFRKEYVGINLDTLQNFVDTHKVEKIDRETMLKFNLVGKNDLVKIMGRGELKAKIEIEAHAFTKTAAEAIVSAGGSTVNI